MRDGDPEESHDAAAEVRVEHDSRRILRVMQELNGSCTALEVARYAAQAEGLLEGTEAWDVRVGSLRRRFNQVTSENVLTEKVGRRGREGAHWFKRNVLGHSRHVVPNGEDFYVMDEGGAYVFAFKTRAEAHRCAYGTELEES